LKEEGGGMSYDAKAVANYFLELGNVSGEQISPMKLQKLIYYAHGWTLAVTGNPLVSEKFQAWKFGPVLPSIYKEFRYAGNSPITQLATVQQYDQIGSTEYQTPQIPATPEHEVTRRILQRIWETYGSYDAVTLSKMTHVPEGPWAKIVTQRPSTLTDGVEIPDDLIRRYFVEPQKATAS